MAEFIKAFQKTIASEGGYNNDPDDPGGETYKGVSRKYHSKWEGWTTIDILKRQNSFPANLEKDSNLRELVGTFYLLEFWNKIHGDDITDQDIAESIFDFAVNAGIAPAVSLAQMVVEAKTDGIIGKQTIDLLNKIKPEYFLSAYTVAKIARYITIVKKRPTSRKYFYGWVCRAMEVES